MKLTIADIAARAGVSKATVSRVLNDRAEGVGAATRGRVQAILDETGFQPSVLARGLATGTTRSIGLIVPDVTNPFDSLLISGAEQALADAGYSLFLCNTANSGARQGNYVRVLIDKRVDGVILDSVGFDAEAQTRQIEQAGIPVVLLDCVVGRRGQRHGVFLDNAHGVGEAMAFLFRRPDRRLVYIGGPDDVSQSVDRRQAVEAVARDLSLGPDRLTIRAGDFSLDSGCRLTEDLIADAHGGPLPFNAIFAANDLMALGAVKALRRAGIAVPEDVEVLGYDDIDFAHVFDPPLSTVAQPGRAMGTAAADLLLSLINKAPPRRKTVVMKPRLVLRGTTLGPAGEPAAPDIGANDAEL